MKNTIIILTVILCFAVTVQAQSTAFEDLEIDIVSRFANLTEEKREIYGLELIFITPSEAIYRQHYQGRYATVYIEFSENIPFKETELLDKAVRKAFPYKLPYWSLLHEAFYENRIISNIEVLDIDDTSHPIDPILPKNKQS